MPLILGPSGPPPGDGGPGPGPGPVTAVGATWTGPDGRELDLMEEFSPTGVMILDDGVAGLGASPRSVTRRALPSGGSLARWSRSEERVITLPLMLQAPTPLEFLELRRDVTNRFVATTPSAGRPCAGTFRVIRSDGTWREIQGVYMSGLSWEDAGRQGVVYDVPVVQLVCDPWWHSEARESLTFGYEEPRDYLNPYETVSPNRTLGAAMVDIVGDVAAAPVWEITGPATSVTVRYEDSRAGWTFGDILPGETITIDVARSTVTDDAGRNRISDLAWSTSRLFSLDPGPNRLLLSITGGVGDQSGIRLTYRPRWETA